MDQLKMYTHPLDQSQIIIGRILQPGETLRSSDYYDSTSGKWELVPYGLVGDEVQPRHGAIIIRPSL